MIIAAGGVNDLAGHRLVATGAHLAAALGKVGGAVGLAVRTVEEAAGSHEGRSRSAAESQNLESGARQVVHTKQFGWNFWFVSLMTLCSYWSRLDAKSERSGTRHLDLCAARGTVINSRHDLSAQRALAGGEETHSLELPSLAMALWKVPLALSKVCPLLYLLRTLTVLTLAHSVTCRASSAGRPISYRFAGRPLPRRRRSNLQTMQPSLHQRRSSRGYECPSRPDSRLADVLAEVSQPRRAPSGAAQQGSGYRYHNDSDALGQSDSGREAMWAFPALTNLPLTLSSRRSRYRPRSGCDYREERLSDVRRQKCPAQKALAASLSPLIFRRAKRRPPSPGRTATSSIGSTKRGWPTAGTSPSCPSCRTASGSR